MVNSVAMVAVISLLLVTLLYAYLYHLYSEIYVGMWAICWFLSSIGIVFDLLLPVLLPGWVTTLGSQFAFLFAGTFLFKGIYIFVNKKDPKWLTLGCGLVGSWIIIGFLIKAPFTPYTIPTFFYMGLLFIFSGAALFEHRRIFGLGGVVVAVALELWGIHLFDFPFIGRIPQFSWGYLVVSILMVTLAIGVLLIYFQKVRRDLGVSEERYRVLAENARDIIYRLQIHPDFRFEFISSAVAQITGYTAEEHYQHPNLFLKTVHPQYRKMLDPVLRGEFTVSERITMPWFHKNGQLVWIEQYIHPVFNREGILIALEGIGRDVTERTRMEEQLRFLSMRDALTGLYNRTFFEQAYNQYNTTEYNPLGLILCDIDGLKLINDTLGHDAGDKLLIAAATAIKDSFRDSDIMARIGGDEFAIVLPRTSNPVIEKAIRRIEETINHHNSMNLDFHLSVSIGYAVRNDGVVSLVDLFKKADNNMYREKLYRSQSARSTIVNTLRKAMEARDFITEGHGERLQELVIRLALAVGYPEHQLTDLKLLAQFHDIGKVGIPDRVLFKPAQLTPHERLEMQRHAEIGYRIAQSSPELLPIAEWILRHHEWWNGSGYPLKLSGEEIPLECRILAIADAFDAMTNDRPYRRALPVDGAIAELRKGKDSQFDSELVDQFVLLINQTGKVLTDRGFEDYYDSNTLIISTRT